MIKIQLEDFDVSSLLEEIKSPSSGCVVNFIGTVRDTSRGREITRMSVEVYKEMAMSQLDAIRAEALEKYSVNQIAVIHRYGDLAVGDNIVYIGVASGHREEGFAACRYIIEELKKRVPIWKKEYTSDGEVWVEGDRHE
jgi:molybdopterin synthase catalytic subunit